MRCQTSFLRTLVSERIAWGSVVPGLLLFQLAEVTGGDILFRRILATPPKTARVAGSNMTVLAEKPEGERLEWSVQTGGDQAESRVKPVTDTNTRAQFTQLIPIHGTTRADGFRAVTNTSTSRSGKVRGVPKYQTPRATLS
jgi:hypothetical protein